LDEWEEAARQEVERQAFINASLGLRDFCATWNNKKDQQCNKQGKWKPTNWSQKGSRDPNAIDVDVTWVQDFPDKEKKERQWTEGRCFACNKQGHIKHNCLIERKGSGTKTSHPESTVRLTQIEEEEGIDKKGMQSTTSNMDSLMAQLRGMSLEEKDEMIDAFIGQENF
jgi:hypothetical protein